MSCIFPPAASTTVLRLRNTCSYCATRSPGAVILPPASLPVCPARKRICPPDTRTPWLNPRGRANVGGLMMVFPINVPPYCFLVHYTFSSNTAQLLLPLHVTLSKAKGLRSPTCYSRRRA